MYLNALLFSYETVYALDHCTLVLSKGALHMNFI